MNNDTTEDKEKNEQRRDTQQVNIQYSGNKPEAETVPEQKGCDDMVFVAMGTEM